MKQRGLVHKDLLPLGLVASSTTNAAFIVVDLATDPVLDWFCVGKLMFFCKPAIGVQ